MSDKVVPFNPLDRKNLEASVAEALLSAGVHALGNLPVFQGAGIYTLYYSGEFPAYAELSRRNLDDRLTAPIYVGKAINPGARKGVEATSESARKPLYSRLCEHRDSIQAAKNLEMQAFHCRFLVVEDIWIPLGESLLIARFSPIWNTLIDGFGNHDPGKGRYKGMRSRWDVLHPGRSWANRCGDRPESAESITRDVKTYLHNAPYPVSTHFIKPD